MLVHSGSWTSPVDRGEKKLISSIFFLTRTYRSRVPLDTSPVKDEAHDNEEYDHDHFDHRKPVFGFTYNGVQVLRLAHPILSQRYNVP